jgi:hypothetical protein
MTTISDKWQAFGPAFWVLPALELRKNNPRMHRRYIMPGQGQRHWPCTYTTTRPRPPTTLPPVLSRNSNYGPATTTTTTTTATATPTGSSPETMKTTPVVKIPRMDGQELYEGSVVRALELLRNPNHPLKKVVILSKRWSWLANRPCN